MADLTINLSLVRLSGLKTKNNRSDYEYGIGNLADIMLTLNTAHKNSFEYKNAYATLVEMGRNAKANSKK